MSRQRGLDYQYVGDAKKITPKVGVRLVAVNSDIHRIISKKTGLRVVDDSFNKAKIKVKTNTSGKGLEGQELYLRGITYTINKDYGNNTGILSYSSTHGIEKYFIDFRSSEPQLIKIPEKGDIINIYAENETVLKTFEKFILTVNNVGAIPQYQVRDITVPNRNDLPSGYSEMDWYGSEQGIYIKCGNFYAGNPSMYRDLYHIDKQSVCKKVSFFGKDDTENQDINLLKGNDGFFVTIDSSRRKNPLDKTQPRMSCQTIFAIEPCGIKTQKLDYIPPLYTILRAL